MANLGTLNLRLAAPLRMTLSSYAGGLSPGGSGALALRLAGGAVTQIIVQRRIMSVDSDGLFSAV